MQVKRKQPNEQAHQRRMIKIAWLQMQSIGPVINFIVAEFNVACDQAADQTAYYDKVKDKMIPAIDAHVCGGLKVM